MIYSFLKVSQKIDSFMSSLGVNVGHTGGSMIAEALVAARGVSAVRNFSRQHFGGGHSSSSSHVNNGSGSPGSPGSPGGFMAGGLAGVVSRQVTNSAIRTATSHTETSRQGGKAPGGSIGGFASAISAGIGGNMYASSVAKGGDFANNVIGTVAAGNISSMGEYYPPWEPPVSRFRATRKWYFPPSEPPQHIVAAHIFDFTINLLIVILGELLMQYHQIIYREVFLCLRRQKSEVFWNFWEKI